MILKFGILLIILLVIGGLGGAYALGFIFNPSPGEPPDVSSIYEFKLRDINGREVGLNTYQGRVLMVVNTASKCGYTPQYEQLQAIYEKYKDQGFVVLGFPANNFLGQEPGTDDEIKDFCTLRYKVTFPMFSKISVKGTDQHPLYTYLTNEKSNPGFSGDIGWNFEKFLIGKDGRTIARFATKIKPDDPSVIEAIENAIR